MSDSVDRENMVVAHIPPHIRPKRIGLSLQCLVYDLIGSGMAILNLGKNGDKDLIVFVMPKLVVTYFQILDRHSQTYPYAGRLLQRTVYEWYGNYQLRGEE